MAGDTVRIVLIPRFTAISGIGTPAFLTKPINVKRFAKVLLTVWQSVGLGGIPSTAQFYLQQSADLEQWENIGTIFPDPPASGEKTVEKDIDLEWIRLYIILNGTTPGVTLWAVGQFVERTAAPLIALGNGR